MNLAALWARTPVGKTIEPGIRKTVSGWQVYLRRDGEFLSNHYPRDEDIATLRRWREKQIGRRMAALDPLPKLDGERSFGEDVRLYLELITHLATYKNRIGWMNAWQQELGADTKRSSITALEIRRVLEKWKRQGLSHATLNLRLLALQNLYTKLDGRSAANITRDVDLYDVRFDGWALPDWADAVKAIDAVDDERERLRLRLFLWTGWPPSQMKQIRPERVNLSKLEVAMPGRKKGRGTPDVILPILPQAGEALRAFLKAEAWKGTWHNSTSGRRLEAACKATGVEPFPPYWLRHLFGTMVAEIVKDDRAVAELLQHRTLQMTARYTKNSVAPRARGAIAAVAERLR